MRINTLQSQNECPNCGCRTWVPRTVEPNGSIHKIAEITQVDAVVDYVIYTKQRLLAIDECANCGLVVS